MKPNYHNPDQRRQRTVALVANFTALMHAYERGELTKASDAQSELERLGVRVRFTRSHGRQRKGGGPC